MIIHGRSVLIEPTKEEESIIITDVDPTPSEYATVIDIGRDIPTTALSIGDSIFYNNRAGRFIKLEDKEFLLISLDDIFITFED